MQGYARLRDEQAVVARQGSEFVEPSLGLLTNKPSEHDSRLRVSEAEPKGDLVGRTIGEYRVLRLLGRGGMGEVYLAEQPTLNRKVALKVLRNELVGDENYLKRFKAEALAVAPLNHPNIVAVYAIGEEAGIHYIAMEYVAGTNLKEYIHRQGALPVPLALAILKRTALALERAHEAGVIHRDIKPENVLLTKRDVKVADFGLARQLGNDQVHVTQQGTAMGTPLYMSPEQIQTHPLDFRTDLYSLGVTAYHMLSGEPPFNGENSFAVALKHLKETAQPLTEIRNDIPPELSDLINKMMAKKPDDRIESADAVVKAVSKIARNLGNQPDSLEELSQNPPANPVFSNSTISSRLRMVSQMVKPKTSRGRVLASLLLAGFLGFATNLFSRERLLDLEGYGPNEIKLADREKFIFQTKVEKKSKAEEQLKHARSLTNEREREQALLAVLLHFHGEPSEVLSASVSLCRYYVQHRELQRALTIAERLGSVGGREDLPILSNWLTGTIQGILGNKEESKRLLTEFEKHASELEAKRVLVQALVDAPLDLDWLINQYQAVRVQVFDITDPGKQRLPENVLNLMLLMREQQQRRPQRIPTRLPGNS